jgi:predicted nucleotidyltransferase
MNNNKMDINIPFIKKIVSIIVSSVDPEQIVLFGSYARGDNDNTSDYESWIDRAKSSYELSKAKISNMIYYEEITKEEYENCLRIAKNCLDWVENKIKDIVKENN